MPTAKGGYFVDGEKVPGTTTIIGRFKESGGLLHWAFQQGVLSTKPDSGVTNLYDKRDEAADIGTRAHAMIEKHLNGEIPSETDDGAINAFEMYLMWERQTHLKFLTKFQEVQLVCSCHRFGGTPDAIGELDGKIMLLDWKTSNGVYQDYLIQLAAYQHLINEGVRMDTGEPLPFKVDKGAHLLRFAKDEPDFAHHYYGNLNVAWEQFTHFRECYELDKLLKKRV